MSYKDYYKMISNNYFENLQQLSRVKMEIMFNYYFLEEYQKIAWLTKFKRSETFSSHNSLEMLKHLTSLKSILRNHMTKLTNEREKEVNENLINSLELLEFICNYSLQYENFHKPNHNQSINQYLKKIKFFNFYILFIILNEIENLDEIATLIIQFLIHKLIIHGKLDYLKDKDNFLREIDGYSICRKCLTIGNECSCNNPLLTTKEQLYNMIFKVKLNKNTGKRTYSRNANTIINVDLTEFGYDWRYMLLYAIIDFRSDKLETLVRFILNKNDHPDTIDEIKQMIIIKNFSNFNSDNKQFIWNADEHKYNVFKNSSQAEN